MRITLKKYILKHINYIKEYTVKILIYECL